MKEPWAFAYFLKGSSATTKPHVVCEVTTWGLAKVHPEGVRRDVLRVVLCGRDLSQCHWLNGIIAWIRSPHPLRVTTSLTGATSPPIARCSRALTLGPCKRAFRCAPLGFSMFSVRNRLHRSRSFPIKTGSYRRRKIRYALLTTRCPHLKARLHVASVDTRLCRWR